MTRMGNPRLCPGLLQGQYYAMMCRQGGETDSDETEAEPGQSLSDYYTFKCGQKRDCRDRQTVLSRRSLKMRPCHCDRTEQLFEVIRIA
jgi:hypothetical protein